jgi:radical SAM protein with 4Fe4S-binding SPASM domain
LEPYRLGHVATGLDKEATMAFRLGPGRTYEKRTPCKECWAAPLCGGPCSACAEVFGPGNGQPLPAQCAYTLGDARAAVWLVGYLRKQDPERLLSFLPRAVDI